MSDKPKQQVGARLVGAPEGRVAEATRGDPAPTAAASMSEPPKQKSERVRRLRRGYPIYYRAQSFPDELRSRLHELLVEGFTVEGAAHYINQDPKSSCRVKEAAVEEFARSDKQLPAQRATYLVETTEAIGATLGGGNEGERRFINAVLMTGLTHLHEGDKSLTVNQALIQRRQLETLTEQRVLAVAKRRAILAAAEVRKEEKKLVKARTDYIDAQTGNLRRLVVKWEKKRNITPETIREIREVYGLIADNVAQFNATPIVLEAQPAASEPVENDSDLQPDPYLANVVNPQAEIQRQFTERARLMLRAAPVEEAETGNSKFENRNSPESGCRADPAGRDVGLPADSASGDSDLPPSREGGPLPGEGEPST